MSDTDSTEADRIRSEIDETRVDLADTVDALSAKLDVKAQAKAKADDVKATVTDTVAKAKPYRSQILAAATVAVVVAIVISRRRKGS